MSHMLGYIEHEGIPNKISALTKRVYRLKHQAAIVARLEEGQ